MEPVESFQPEPLQLLIIGCIPKGLHQRTVNPQLTFWSQISFASAVFSLFASATWEQSQLSRNCLILKVET